MYSSVFDFLNLEEYVSDATDSNRYDGRDQPSGIC